MEVYKTQAARLLQDYGYESSPAPIKIIDASAAFMHEDSAEDEDTENEDAIMIFKAEHKPAALYASRLPRY
jgi:hypothetical protein